MRCDQRTQADILAQFRVVGSLPAMHGGNRSGTPSADLIAAPSLHLFVYRDYRSYLC